jgi:hypothetical protein
MMGSQKTKQDWPKGYKLNAFYVPRGVGGQVVVVMLWPATNHTEFKLYAFSFNTHHAPETAAACRIEVVVAPRHHCRRRHLAGGDFIEDRHGAAAAAAAVSAKRSK